MVQTVPVSNFVLLKKVQDDDRLGLCATGTFIQTCYLNSKDHQSLIEKFDKETEKQYFPYRINDFSREEKHLIKRMTKVDATYDKKSNITSKSYRTNFSFMVPIMTDTEFDGFPFKCSKATLSIEFSTITGGKQQVKYLPELLIDKVDRRGNFAIQEAEEVRLLEDEGVKKEDEGKDHFEDEGVKKEDEGKDRSKEREMKGLREAISKLDDSEEYDFISVKPQLSFKYAKNKSCSRLDISFHLVSSGFTHFVGVAAPLLLIAIMNTFHVLFTDGSSVGDFVGNSAAFALTAVFILPEIIEPGTTQTLFNWNNLFVLMIFLGLGLSSFPVIGDSVKTDEEGDGVIQFSAFAFAGMVILWLSFLVPWRNFLGYSHYLWKLFHEEPKYHAYSIWTFLKEPGYKPNKVKNCAYEKNYWTVKDVCFPPNSDAAAEIAKLYKCEKEIPGKFSIVEYKDDDGIYEKNADWLSNVVFRQMIDWCEKLKCTCLLHHDD